MRLAIALGLVGAAACAAPKRDRAPYTTYAGGAVPQSRAADADMVRVPAGSFVAGSTTEERDIAYADYAATAGNDSARSGNWFDREDEPRQGSLESYVIDRTAVTNAAYAEFVADTGIAPPPGWDTSGRPEHPVVEVTWYDAAAYCAWRGSAVGRPRRLPSADEYEKAARGESGKTYPWGNSFDRARLNSAVSGVGGTVPVGQYDDGASPYGMLDGAGNVAQWTSTPWTTTGDTMTVKGSSWEDFGGVGRGAWAHGRDATTRHPGTGFRCAGD